jgi:hypothetical protein
MFSGGSKAGTEVVAQRNIPDPDGIESRAFMLYPVTSRTDSCAGYELRCWWQGRSADDKMKVMTTMRKMAMRNLLLQVGFE